MESVEEIRWRRCHLQQGRHGESTEPFITGFLVDNNYIGRPVDVEIMKDGSMLVSDDWNGAIYRITYGKARVASQ